MVMSGPPQNGPGTIPHAVSESCFHLSDLAVAFIDAAHGTHELCQNKTIRRRGVVNPCFHSLVHIGEHAHTLHHERADTSLAP